MVFGVPNPKTGHAKGALVSCERAIVVENPDEGYVSYRCVAGEQALQRLSLWPGEKVLFDVTIYGRPGEAARQAKSYLQRLESCYRTKQ
ncbi:MAG: hypothetical protein QXF55_02445 [Candidatus Aenigmatarchaeota archaeon]